MSIRGILDWIIYRIDCNGRVIGHRQRRESKRVIQGMILLRRRINYCTRLKELQEINIYDDADESNRATGKERGTAGKIHSDSQMDEGKHIRRKTLDSYTFFKHL